MVWLGVNLLQKITVTRHFSSKINTYYGDLLDQTSIEKLLFEIKPDEIYNLGAQSHVRVSFDIPNYSTNQLSWCC